MLRVWKILSRGEVLSMGLEDRQWFDCGSPDRRLPFYPASVPEVGHPFVRHFSPDFFAERMRREESLTVSPFLVQQNHRLLYRLLFGQRL